MPLVGTVHNGYPKITFQAGNYSKVLWDKGFDTHFSLLTCCEVRLMLVCPNCLKELRQGAGALWDGNFSLSLSLSLPVSIEFEIPRTPDVLPLSTWFPLVPVTLTCSGVELECPGCALNVKATSDAFYTFWEDKMYEQNSSTPYQNSSIDIPGSFQLPEAESLDSSISTIFWVKRTRGADLVCLVNIRIF